MTETVTRISSRELTKAAAPAMALGMAVLAWFLPKAFTIDDVTFLLQARHILTDPLHPTAFDIVHEGQRFRLSEIMVTGPVMAYLLVPAVLANGSEWVAHLTNGILLLIGTAATARLALRVGLTTGQAAVAALLVVVSPAVLAMASTAMPDVPAMAFAALAIERFLTWDRSRTVGAGISSAVFLAAAALTRPQALMLIPCAGAYLLICSRHRHRVREWRELTRGAAPLLGAMVLVAATTVVTADPAAPVNSATAAARVSGLFEGRFWSNTANLPLQWALSFPLTLLWIGLRGMSFWKTRRVLAGMTAGAVLGLLGDLGPLAVISALSCAVLADVVIDALTRKDGVQTLLGLWLLIGLVAAPYPHLPAKYLVPSAPAMAVLLCRLPLERLRLLRPFVVATAISFLTLGVLIIRADATLAEVGRVGGVLVREYAAQGGEVWIDGGWGFQWYGMEAGGKPLATTGPFPKKDDLIVVGPRGWQAAAWYPKKELLQRRLFTNPGGRLFGEGAGFYISGPLPWVWGRGEIGRLEAWKLTETAAKP